MGKKQKIRSGTGDVVTLPGPLDKQIEKAKMAKNKIRLQKNVANFEKKELEEEISDAIHDAKLMRMVRKQRVEEEQNNIASNSEDENETEVERMTRNVHFVDEELQKLTTEDEEAINKFLKPHESNMKKTLHSLIQAKVFEKKVSIKDAFAAEEPQIHDLNPEVAQLYREVGVVMSRYRCGKVPKAFKVIPSMVNWEQILELTNPDNWSAAAMLQATRLFCATANPSMCQRFFNLVLLPRIRDEIDEYKKLNFHMYECLFKAIYKPASFFKGILLPLIESGTCTLREAIIIGSVLRKISIPVLHAAAAMLKISEMEYCGSSSLILRILIEKRYTLPFRAIDGLVFSFLRMRSSKHKELPVLWHQCLLAFVEQYKRDISSEQREALLELLKVHSHYLITPEIRHHLQMAESRNEESEGNVPEYAREDFEDNMEF